MLCDRNETIQFRPKTKQGFSEFRKRTGREFHGWNSRKDWTRDLKWYYYGYSPPPSSAQQAWAWPSFSPWMTGLTFSIFFHGRGPEKRKSLVVVPVKVPGTILVGQSCQMPSFVCLFVCCSEKWEDWPDSLSRFEGQWDARASDTP